MLEQEESGAERLFSLFTFHSHAQRAFSLGSQWARVGISLLYRERYPRYAWTISCRRQDDIQAVGLNDIRAFQART